MLNTAVEAIEMLEELKQLLLTHWRIKGRYFARNCEKYDLQVFIVSDLSGLKIACEATNKDSPDSKPLTYTQKYAVHELTATSWMLGRMAWMNYKIVEIANALEAQIYKVY